MNEHQFCRWLQGYFEVGKPKSINSETAAMISRHLELALNPVWTGIFDQNITPINKKTEINIEYVC